jgi:hypothetical protein
MPTMQTLLRRKPSFHRVASAIPDYFLASGNKNDFQEAIICNIWLLLLVGCICYQYPSLMILVWFVSADYIIAKTTTCSGLENNTSDEQLVPADSEGSNCTPQVKKEE